MGRYGCVLSLVGYWFEDKNNSLAAIKAFIMNRIGDVGFLLAMFLCYKFFGTLNYSLLAQSVTSFVNSGATNIHSSSCSLVSDFCLVLRENQHKSPLYLVTRCHGRSHSSFCTYPCSHNGHRRYLFIKPYVFYINFKSSCNAHYCYYWCSNSFT